MSRTDEVIRSVQYVVDENGKQTAVLLDLNVWQQVLQLLEEFDEDERLGNLMVEVTDDEKLEGAEAIRVYREYLAANQS